MLLLLLQQGKPEKARRTAARFFCWGKDKSSFSGSSSSPGEPQNRPLVPQGLCSFGFACRIAIQELIPGEPERTTRMAAQMSSVLYPDTPVKMQIWKMEEGKAYFRFVNQSSGKPVLNRGVFEWR